MALALQKFHRYWSHGRFRMDYIVKDGEEVVAENRLSFNDEPDQPAEDAAFVDLLDRLSLMRARQLNRLNQRLEDRFGSVWLEVRPTLLNWIAAHPSATAAQAATAYETAFLNSPYDAARLFTALMAAFNPPFDGWVEFRDYVVANIASAEEV